MQLDGNTTILSDMSRRGRTTVLGAIMLMLLVCGLLVTLSNPVQAGLTSLNGNSNSCLTSGCHGPVSTAGTIAIAANGTAGTPTASVTVKAGSTFEADWKFSVKGSKSSVGTMLLVPSGWTASAGTANSTGLSGWNSNWTAADGIGWSQNCFATGDGFPNTTCYSTNFINSSWDAGNRDTALDDGTEPDTAANSMGTDATVTIPATQGAGTGYTVTLIGVGHDGASRTHVKQTVAVTVTPDVTSASPNSMAQGTGPTTVTINGAGFTNTGLSVSFSGTGVTAGTPTYVSATQITVPVTVAAGATTGARDVTVTCSGQSGTGTGVFSVTGGKLSQTITVGTPAPSSAAYNSQFTVAATASSGLAVTYSSGSPAVCTNSGATFTMVSGTGTCIVQYDQAGDATYDPATQVTNNTTATKINQATVTVSAPASATYGQTGLSATASGGSGTGAYSYSAGSSTACTVNPSTGALTITSGTGTCSITATRATDSNYNVSAASAPATVTISKATQATVTVSAPASAYYGQTGLSATAGGGSGTGAYSYDAGSSTACSVNPSSGALTITSGTGTCSITATRAADTNYDISAASAPATVTITKADPTVTAWPTATAITYGQTLASSTLSGGTSTPSGTFAFTTPATAPNAGTAAQGVTFTPTDAANYNTAAGTTSVTVNKADPTVTAWPTATAITYGQTLASSTLSGGTSTPAGTFAFTTPSTAPNAGTAPQGLTFTPTDTANYNTAAGTASVTVNKADPTVTAWPTATAITYGQTLASSTLSGGTSTPAGSFAFTTPSTAPNAGTAAQGVTFTPTDTANYNTADGTASVTVNKADPTVTAWPTATAITYGQTLASSTLSGGTSTPAGSFAFTTPSTAPNAGTAPQGVTFTPTDTANYNTAAGTTSVTVNKADPTVTAWPIATAITYGQTLASSTLSGGTSTPAGTFAFTTPSTAPNAGTAAQGVTFTPTDTANYNTADGTASVTVNKADPTVTAWPTATAITYGQTLASSTLSGGTSTPAGTFAFTTPSTAPNAGTAPQGVTFTPTDTTNYNTATGTTSVTVNKADPTVTAWPTATAITYGQTLASSTLSGGTATPAGTFAFTTPATAPNAGTAAQGVTFTPTDTTNYNTATGTADVTVAQATPTVSAWPTASSITSGQALSSSTLTGGTASTAGSFAFTTPSTIPPEGLYSAAVTFTPADTTNYTTVTGSVDVNVTSGDTTSPTAAITYSAPGPYKSGANVTITATFSEDMADSPVPQIAISGANTLTATNMTKSSATVYTYAYTVGTGDGAATVSIPTGKDLAGNDVVTTPTSGTTFTVDNTAPVISATSPASDSYRNNANIAYTLSDAVTSGSVTFTRTGGTADGTSPHTYTLIPGDMTSGSHNINTSLPLVNGAIYSVSFDATDAAGNTATQVVSTNVLYDTTAAAVTLSSPAAGSRTNNANVNYSLSKEIQSGQIIFTRTGGTVDGSSPHTYNLSGGDLASGSHTAVNTGFTLVDGAIYTVSAVNVLDLAGNPSANVDNTSVTFDSTSVAITNTAPVTGSSIKTALVSYTLSEQAASGTVTFTRTGGTADPGSPRTFTLSGANLNAGAHTDVDSGLSLVDGAIYTVSFNATDLAGNPATAVSNASVTFDTSAPTLDPVQIASNNADPSKAVVGDIVTLSFTSSESITAPTVTIAGSAAAVTGGPTAWTATHAVLAADPLGATTFSITSFSDAAGNAGSTVTAVTDSSSVTKIKANPSVTEWPTASGITYGQALSASTLTGGSAAVSGSFAFAAPATMPGAGAYGASVIFTPTDTTNYDTAASTVNVTVAKADSNVTAWPTASGITYGQTLASSTLTGGTSTPAGSFAFTTPATAPNAGTAAQSVTFTPTDAANYNTATGTVDVTVAQATPTVTAWPTASSITYGQTLAASTLTGGTASTAGSFAFTIPATAPNAGTAAQDVTFTPTDAANYTTTTGTVSVTVNKADQTITFDALAGKTYGDASFALTATGGTSGNPVTYSSSDEAVATVSGNTVTIVGAGITTITASQAGSANYNAASNVFQALTVDRASQTISFAALASKTVGDPAFTLTATGGASGNPVTFTSSNEAVATVSGNTVTIVGAGSTNITASQAGNANYYAASDVIQPLTVNAAGNQTLSVTISGNGSVNSNPAGIACTGGTCNADFTTSQSVDLTATPGGNYVFAGWTGGACDGTTTNPCTVIMNSPTSITATFTAQPFVKLPGGNYASMMEAYIAATDGQTMQLRDQIFTENLDFNRAIQVKLDGGWNTDFTAVTGNTTINGTVTVTDGGITISNVIIQ